MPRPPMALGTPTWFMLAISPSSVYSSTPRWPSTSISKRPASSLWVIFSLLLSVMRSVSFRAVQKAGSEGAGYGLQSLDDTAGRGGVSVADDAASARPERHV